MANIKETNSTASGAIDRREFIRRGAGTAVAFAASPLLAAFGQDATGARLLEIEPRFSLAGAGWFGPRSVEAPPKAVGNRLRWFYPSDAIQNGSPVGTPASFTVERALVRQAGFDPNPTGGRVATMTAPDSFWRRLASPQVLLSDPLVIQVPRCQAIWFVYEGPDGELSVEDSCSVLRSRVPVRKGDRFYFERAAIDLVRFPGSAGASQVVDLRYLDLYNSSALDLQFEDVARLLVRGPLAKPEAFSTVRKRTGNDAPDVLKPIWDAVVETHRKALAEADPAKSVELWQGLSVLVSSSWQISTLSGHGYVDGPIPAVPGLDFVGSRLAAARDRLAYRIKVDDRVGTQSNVVFVDPSELPTLQAPTNWSVAPWVIRPRDIVTLGGDDGTKGAAQLSFVAESGCTWNQDVAVSTAIEVSCALTESKYKGVRAGELDPSLHVPNRYGRLVRIGAADLRAELPFVDVRIDSRARTVDGWDRFSLWTPQTIGTMSVDFEQAGPPLGTATFSRSPDQSANAGVTTVNRVNDWRLGPARLDLLRFLNANLFLYRRRAEPPTADVNVVQVLPAHDGVVEVRVDKGLANADLFEWGVLAAGDTSWMITTVRNDLLTIKVRTNTVLDTVGSCGATVATTSFEVPSLGRARLVGSPGNSRLWSDSTDFEVPWPGGLAQLSAAVSFNEAQVPRGDSDIRTYGCRVKLGSGLGIANTLGPFSNCVSVRVLPPVPPQPPPFDVRLLGVDYYAGALIEIELTEPVVGALCSVSWSPGRLQRDIATFVQRRTEGRLPRQVTYQERFLYQSLPAPEDRWRDLYYTVGVKIVDSAGQEGPWRLREFLIEAA